MNEITLHFTTDVYRIDNQIKDTPTGQKIGEFAEKRRNYTSIKQVGVWPSEIQFIEKREIKPRVQIER